MKKRVWSLYRVSTEKQTDGDDIPMQRNACREFVDNTKDWQLERELLELGVSGFKKFAKDRDAIETLRKAAINKEFDILLVFMYDRLGRKHEETPFIVEWFVKQGIEVWSVKDGQRKFDNHVDSLTNYITFWQASGESIKTSQRVTEAISQMNEDGHYTGGTPPYGYEVFDTGIKHSKRDKNIKILKINTEEAEMIKKMFDLVINKGFGSPRISSWLNRNGYTLRNGSPWKSNYISRLLRNTILIGYKRYGYFEEGGINWDEVKLQPFNKDLVIIDESDFKKAQQIIDSRKANNDNDPNIKNLNTPTKSKLLLSGIAVCGYCGCKLTADYSIKKNILSNGEEQKSTVYRYTCKNAKSLIEDTIHVSKQFGAKKYEKEVELSVKEFIKKVKKDDFLDEMRKYRKVNVATKIKTLEKIKKEVQSDYQELSAIKTLIIKVEMGQSKLSAETVEEMLLEQEKKIAEKGKLLSQLEYEVENENSQLSDYQQVLDEFDDWDNKYDNADLDTKKMMLFRIIEHLSIKKDEIKLKMILPLNNTLSKEVQNSLDTDRIRVLNTPPVYGEVVAIKFKNGVPTVQKSSSARRAM